MSDTSDSLDAVVIHPEKKPEYGVIWLHGLGANGHDFEPVARQLAPALPHPVRWVLPHAPHLPVTINGGLEMPAWYDILSMEPKRHDPASIKPSHTALMRLVEAQAEHGLRPERIFLAGFSQGGALTLHTALRAERAFAGLIILSSLWLDLGNPKHAPAAYPEVPIFMAHGTADPVIELHYGERSAEALRSRGFDVDFRSYPMPHSVSPEELSDLHQWLLKRMQS